MEFLYRYLISGLWIMWLVYWILAARSAKSTVRQESVLSRASHFGLLFAAVFLSSWPDHDQNFLFDEIWPRVAWTFWAGVILTLLGFSFTIWARVALGRNWSGVVTLKANHELIRSGPYAWVRHPIYTGILLAFVGTAVCMDEWRGVLACGLVLVSLLIKLKIEERWMTEHFGPSYEAYRKRVAMLVPMVW
jgi:protein-S-isoprenylcysteine O-methyltransferase Ste14